MSGLQRNRFRVRLFHAVTGLGNWLAALPNKLIPPPFRLIQMGSAYWQSRTLYVAAELGIADNLGEEVKNIQVIASELKLHQENLYRLMRMLASLGVFEESSARCFRNSKLSHYLRRDHPQSVRAMVLMHNSPQISTPWFDSLGLSMHTGEVPFALSHGKDLFAYMDNHPQFDALFTEAMEAVEGLTGTDYLHDFDWGRFDRLIDVGGSNGKKSITILQAHPQLRATIFDRHQVVAGAADYWRGKLASSLFERIEFTGGDMLEEIPRAQSDKDLYLFVAVFHGFGDEEAGRVLENLKSACGVYRPTIVIADSVAQSTNIDPTIAAFDMQMLVCTRGRERTIAEWRVLLGRSGFSIQEVVDVRTFAKLLVVQAS